MRAKLFSKSGTFKGQSFEIEGDTSIGRREDNVIVLRSRTVSSRHARIYPDEKGESFLLEDLGSLNGTRIDGIRAVGTERLGALHVITFADDADFVFRLGPGVGAAKEPTLQEASAPVWPVGSAHEASDAPTTLADDGDLPLVPDFLLEPSESATEPLVEDLPVDGRTAARRDNDTCGAARRDNNTCGAAEVETAESPPLVLMVGGERIELAEGEHTIGRGEDASVTLEEHSVSRRHAALTWRNGRAVLRDLGSSNGTFIGDRKIDAEERLDLPVTVSFGAVEVIL